MATWKHIVLAWFVGLLLTLPALAQGQPDATYGRRILLAATPHGPLIDALDDLQTYLPRITGQTFETVVVNAGEKLPEGPAIVLCLRENADAGAGDTAALAQRSVEAFLLRDRAGQRLYIIGNSRRAIAWGIYAWLEHLGVRWLFPTETWTIVPKRDSLVTTIDRIEEPTFLVRGHFATGGFGGNLPLDPKRQLQGQWNRWSTRMRYGGPYRLGGHAGEAFVNRNKAALEAHPEYMAMIDGKRLTVGEITKPCYTNPGLVELYVNDRLATLRQQIKIDPDGPNSHAISVDPSDGGGHCECPDCVKLGSVSDRVFTLANHVARAVARELPGKFVSLYAYNEHAAPPSIDLEPNVIVMLVPYGLQRTGMTGEQMIEAWSKKTRSLSIYDYWALTDWSNDLPEFDFLNRIPNRLGFWQDRGVEAVALQSSATAGGMGVPFYLTSRKIWNPDLDLEAELAKFCAEAFGAAAPPMQRMFTRWGREFLLGELELAQCYRDLQEADALATDPAVQARVDDFRRYVHYLRLWMAYEDTKRESPERHAASAELVRYLWRIYWTGMVHAYRMHVLMCNRYERKDEALGAAWPLKETGGIWDTIKPVEHNELDTMMAAGLADFPLIDYERRSYSDDLVPLVSSPTSTGTAAFAPLHGQMRFRIHVASPRTSIDFDMRCGPGAAGYPGDPVTLHDLDGKELFRQLVPADGQLRTITIPVPAPGDYELRIYDQKAFARLAFPRDLPMAYVSDFVSGDLCPPMHFFVPRGLKQVAIYQRGALMPIIRDSRNRVIAGQGTRFLILPVPEGEDGKVWSISKFKSYTPLRLLNVPQALSLDPQAMLVPRELLVEQP